VTSFGPVIDAIRLVLTVGLLYVAIFAVLHRRFPAHGKALRNHRLALVLGLIAVMVLIKVTEDVLDTESRAFDEAVLHFLHAHVGAGLVQVFWWLTLSASSKLIFPVIGLLVLGLFLRKLRNEALFLAISTVSGALIVTCVKALVARERPALWDTDWYWGSSFPSGHTVDATTTAVALIMIVQRRYPKAAPYAVAVGAAWAFLVGVSRMILGVHWPTDVAAAWCIGILLPFATTLVMQVVSGRRKPPV